MNTRWGERAVEMVQRVLQVIRLPPQTRAHMKQLIESPDSTVDECATAERSVGVQLALKRRRPVAWPLLCDSETYRDACTHTTVATANCTDHMPFEVAAHVGIAV